MTTSSARVPEWARDRRPSLTLIEVILSCVVLAVVAALVTPAILKSRRASRERNASASMKTLTTAEADFRSNDRDGNGVNDFWTGDVFALYGLIPIAAGAKTVPADGSAANIKLIERAVAAADGATKTGLCGNIELFSGSANMGYIYRAFAAEQVGDYPVGFSAFDPPNPLPPGNGPLMNDTDGPGLYGEVHHRNCFAFMAFPETLSEGRIAFIVNEDNTIWKRDLPESYRATYSPLTPTADSTSTVVGTGNAGCDNATAFPTMPLALTTGVSKGGD